MVGDKTFFWPREGDLAVTDGTALGTRRLPVQSTGECSAIFDRVPLGSAAGVFYWVECWTDIARGVLWRSDGTAQGTFQLTNAYTHYLRMPSTFLNEPAEEPTHAFAGGLLHFQACAGSDVCTRWRTDGTPAGTRAVREGERDVGGAAAVGDRLF
jgi:hypothetical protein